MRVPLVTCPQCACFHRPGEGTCPTCGAPVGVPLSSAAAVLLAGLALGGCLGKSVAMYGVEPPYGIADDTGEYDADGDGYAVADGDCDDQDEAVYPGAEEIPGDDIDSNCDGEDDT